MSSDEPQDQAASWSKRLRARELGDVPVSRDLTSAFSLAGGLAILSMFANECWNAMESIALENWRWSGASNARFDPLEMLAQAGMSVGRPLLFLGGGVFLFAFAVGWIQSGCGMFWNRMLPDWSRLSPVRNWRQAHSFSHWTSSLIGMLRWLILWAVVMFCIWSARDSIVAIDQEKWLAATATAVFSILLKVVAAIGALGCIDYALQWWLCARRLRMSPNEMREELRASQIDPNVLQRRKSVARGFVQNGIIRAVRKSNLILTDTTGAVIGLALPDRKDELPTIVMRAGAAHAEATKQIAARFGIPVQNHLVASAIFARCRIEDTIPLELAGVIRALDLRSG